MANGSPRHKHEIRKALHPQLKRLWEVHPNLKAWKVNDSSVWDGDDFTMRPGSAVRAAAKPVWQELADRHQCNGFKFVPLAMEEHSLLVGLEILFLRPDLPGGVIKSADIDNRLKTLFDAFKMPSDAKELGGYAPAEDEEPFFVLLGDDEILSHVSVETDILLQPTPSAEGKFLPNDARLVITVSLKPYKVTLSTLHFV